MSTLQCQSHQKVNSSWPNLIRTGWSNYATKHPAVQTQDNSFNNRQITRAFCNENTPVEELLTPEERHSYGYLPNPWQLSSKTAPVHFSNLITAVVSVSMPWWMSLGNVWGSVDKQGGPPHFCIGSTHQLNVSLGLKTVLYLYLNFDQSPVVFIMACCFHTKGLLE